LSLSSSFLEDSSTSQDDEKMILKLKERAQQLRNEIEEFEKQKNDLADEERERQQKLLDDKRAIIDHYSVVLPILKPDGTTVEEKIQFPPRLVASTSDDEEEEGSSTVFTVEANLPLGILLGEHETFVGITEVDEVVKGSNGDLAGIKEGDLLRACTACKMEMVTHCIITS
jgi:small-conductance mechanosensitive channel